MSDEPIFELELECAGCPEVWNFYHEEEYVGYTRLRHGTFYCSYEHEWGCNVLFNVSVDDELTHNAGGTFRGRATRDLYLGEAAKHLAGYIGIPIDGRTLYTREENSSYE